MDKKTKERVKELAKESAKDPIKYALEYMNKRYAVAQIGSNVVVIDKKAVDEGGEDDIAFMTETSMRMLYKNKFIEEEKITEMANGSTIKKIETTPIFKKWMEWDERRTYFRVVFDPSATQRTDTFNLWSGFRVEPKQGDTSIFWEHVENIICDGDYEKYTYMRKWFAHCVQKTGELPMVAPVWKSLQGTGKGITLKFIEDIFGNHYGEYSSLERVLGRFNGHLKNKIIIVANEATWGGNKKMEGDLKALITDVHRSIEMKGKEPITIKSCSRLIVTSNEDWAVPIGIDDRRFVVFDVSAEKKDDLEYFKKLVKFRQNDGAAYILYDLLKEDIEDWNPLSRPKSAEVSASLMKLESMSFIEQFILGWIMSDNIDQLPKSNDFPGYKQLVFGEFHEKYIEYMNKYHRGMRVDDPIRFSKKVFGRLIPFKYKKKINLAGSTQTLFVIPNTKHLKEYFETKVLYSEFDWDDVKEAIKEGDGRDNIVQLLSSW